MRYNSHVLRERSVGIKARRLLHFDESVTDRWLLQWHEEHTNQSVDKLAPSLEIRYYDQINVSGYESLIYSEVGIVLDDNCILPETIRNQKNSLQSSIDQSKEIVICNDTCLVYQSHGSNVYRHFLIDMLPRLLILRELNFDFSKVRIVSRHDVSEWHKQALKEFFSIEQDQFVFFNPSTQILKLNRAIVPSFTRNDTGFHPYTNDLFQRFVAKRYGANITNGASRSLIIDRREWRTSHSIDRRIDNINYLMDALRDIFSGDIIDPSKFSIREQIEISSNAKQIIGEYSSALHNSIFAPKGSFVLSIGHLNLLQSSICALREQDIAYISTKPKKDDSKALTLLKEPIDFFRTVSEKIESRGVEL